MHNILARGVLTETDLLWCTRGADQVLAYIEIRISGGCFCEGCLGVPDRGAWEYAGNIGNGHSFAHAKYGGNP